MNKLWGRRNTEEALDATGREWKMSSTPARHRKRYEVRISAYFDEKNQQFRVGSFVGVGATFEEAAEKALRNAGLLKQAVSPPERRTIDFSARIARWSSALFKGHA